jgi:hypothetical protein
MICTKCDSDKEENGFYWNSSKSSFEKICKECVKSRRRQRYEEDPLKERESHYKYVDNNRDSVNVYKKQWAKDNKKKRSDYARYKYQSDPIWRLKSCLRSRLTTAVSKKLGSTMELVGCDIDTLCSHLESQFQKGMTWINYGEWHVDHIRPCASFDLSNLKQQKECFHYTNLQPLWAADNLAKASGL